MNKIQMDSLEKLEYFMELTNRKHVEISPGFFRDFAGCLEAACGACCHAVSLDYLEDSERWKILNEKYPHRIGDFEQRKVGSTVFMTNNQGDKHKDSKCMYLNKENGLCTIHEANPLGCSLPMVKFLNKISQEKGLLISTTYGRQWALTKVTGEKGGICYMTDYTRERTLSDISKLKELQTFAERIDRWPTDTLAQIIVKLEEIVSSGIIPTEKIVIR